jgi:hypothetical protein
MKCINRGNCPEGLKCEAGYDKIFMNECPSFCEDVDTRSRKQKKFDLNKRMTDREKMIEMLERNKIEYRVCIDNNTIEINHFDCDKNDTTFSFDKNNNLKKIDS